MLQQTIKDQYYNLLLFASHIALPLYKAHYSLRKKSITKVHAGCGKHYMSDFINIDGNYQRKVDYLLDMRVGLPFPSNSIDFIYSCHMLEHVHVNEALHILQEWHRVLKPSGRVHLSLPDFKGIFQVLDGREDFIFPRQFATSYGQAINFLFCDGQHKYAYCPENIKEIAASCGFDCIQVHELDPLLPQDIQEPTPKFSFSVRLTKSTASA